MNRYVLLGCLVLAVHCTPPSIDLVIQPVVNHHKERYPSSESADWYKLAHQAAMGVLHLGADPDHIRTYLEEEWASIRADAEQPLIDYLSPDSQVVRLHLRPFKACGGSPELVFEALSQTRASFTPSEDTLESYLTQMTTLLEDEQPAFSAFVDEQRQAGFPAVHHSEKYTALHQPAYRVLLAEWMPSCPNYQSN